MFDFFRYATLFTSAEQADALRKTYLMINLLCTVLGECVLAEKHFRNYVILCTSAEQADALRKTFPALPDVETAQQARRRTLQRSFFAGSARTGMYKGLFFF